MMWNVLLTILELICLARLGWLLWLVLVATIRWGTGGVTVLPGDPQRLAVGICAHNEERVIFDTVRRVREQGAACYVMCDDCTDDTVALVQLGGGEVLRGVYHSKAKALWSLMSAMRAGGYDYMAIIDADTVIQEDFCALMVGGLDQYPVVQGALRSLNADTFVAGWMAMQTAIHQRFTEYARDCLHLPGVLCGTGWGIRWSVLRCVPCLSSTVTEDIEYTYRLLGSGFRVKYLPEIVVENEHTRDVRSLLRQMERWMRGSVQTWRHEWRVVLRHPDLLLGVAMYPLGLIDVAMVAVILWYQPGALFTSGAWYGAIGTLALLQRGELGCWRWRSIIAYPMMLLAVLGAEARGIVRAGRQEWLRTEHYGSVKDV